MKDYREVSKEEVLEVLKTQEVCAVVLSSTDRLIKGGDFKKSGVYTLSASYSLSDIYSYLNEDNVAFYAQNKEASH